jgi:hypothetical protein
MKFKIYNSDECVYVTPEGEHIEEFPGDLSGYVRVTLSVDNTMRTYSIGENNDALGDLGMYDAAGVSAEEIAIINRLAGTVAALVYDATASPKDNADTIADVLRQAMEQEGLA